MNIRLPTSILQLTLIGFSLVALPLIAALMIAVIQVDGLAGKGRRAVLDTAQAVHASRIIVEQVTAMERNARQFQVLRDQSFYLHYQNRQSEFMQAVEVLSELDLDTASRELLEQLVQLEQDLYHVLLQTAEIGNETVGSITEFPPMVEVARSMSYEISQFIARDADEMRRQAQKAKHILLILAVSLIPATLVLAATFTVLITKPLRRIDHEIRRLGSGKFSDPISVGGPQDLRELSIRLDWLRIRLNDLEEQKRSFLRSISHELKTPLSAIREGVELLNDEVVGTLSSEQAEVATILRDNSLQLQQRIEDLLKFNVAISQPSKLHPVRIQLDEMIREVLGDHRLTSRSKHLVIDERLARIGFWGDREKLKIIVDNLLSNAIKFSPVGGKINLELVSYDTVAVMDVSDEGPGIDSQERHRVFEAFYQGKATHRGHVKGTGLGLAIVQEYVKMHRGKIEILNQPKGAHMRVYLPLKQEQVT